ncbi:TPA: hypothetical protein DE059_05235 [Candidatus Peribacteria bacterium]|nr:hypothetical protein [Candidatus Peribacteria bacterium]
MKLLYGRLPASILTGILFLGMPLIASAAEDSKKVFGMNDQLLTIIGLVALGAVIGCGLASVWVGICNHMLMDHESPESFKKRKPYLPTTKVVIGTVIATGCLFVLSLKVLDGVIPFSSLTPATMLMYFFIVGGLMIAAEYRWKKARDYVFAVLMGSGISFGLMGLAHAILQVGVEQDPFVMALGIVCTIILWRLLFGPWSPRIKAIVLGSFILWIGMHVIFKEDPGERYAHLIATLVALVPALVWCWFFLEYHKQHFSFVLLMFFAGMLSTAPILFYDALVRRGVEFQFFLFRIVPENFSRASNVFVSGTLVHVEGIRSTILAMFISFVIVGIIEESSKLWVLKKSGARFFSSIDDVIQMAVIVAIGFAFAENVLNPSYFLGFVREYLTEASESQWWVFLGNVSGRSILTTMVHIVSSGVLGYFLGLSIFAKSYLTDVHKRGEASLFADLSYWLFRIPPKKAFRVQVMIVGLIIATLLHGFFNFMVTLPDMLPNNPQTFGDLFGFGSGNVLHLIPILLLPSFLYIVGGFWVFTTLFYKQESMKERGRLVNTDTFVKGKIVGA